MKKYLTMCISALLIITSIFFVPTEHSDVKFGKGNGKSASITTVKELGDVFDFVTQLKFSAREETNSGIKTLSYSKISNNENNTADTKNQYTSVTLHNISQSSIMYYNTHVSIDRKLSIYMTQYEAYYKSSGKLSSADLYGLEVDKPNKLSYIDFDVEIFIDITGVMLKFNKFDILGNDIDFKFSDAVFGKWFKFCADDDITGDIGAVDLMNKEILTNIGRYFEEKKAYDFNTKGNVYSLKEGMLSDALECVLGISVPQKFKGEFTVDLSNAKSPSLILVLDCSLKEGSQSASAYAYEKINFENINNTVLKGFKDNLEIEIVEDPDEFANEYFMEMEG